MTDFFEKSTDTPDLSTISILFCTPTGDGKYEREFVSSIFSTMKELERLGARAQFANFPYCADLALARAKLLGTFYRSEHTHMMWIDADMGWKPQDVVRLVLHEKDYIGAAGPKKKYPLEFAANNIDEHGSPIPCIFEGTELIEIAEVGLAFILMSRECVSRMVNCYESLEFNGGNDTKEYALFDPIILNGRRLSEDFAFARRWQKIGGKIHLIPDIRLTHTGAHKFEGALSDLFTEENLYHEPKAA